MYYTLNIAVLFGPFLVLMHVLCPREESFWLLFLSAQVFKYLIICLQLFFLT